MRALLLFSLLAVPSAWSADLSFSYNQFITGANGLITGTPKAEFTNLTNPDQVRLTMSLEDLTAASEFVLEWYFNLNPLFEAAPGLNFAYDAANSNGPADSSISTAASANSYSPSVGDAGQFDIRFNFTSSNSQQGAQRLNAPEYVSYIISRSGGLRASDFDFANSKGYLSALHVGGLANGQSVKLGAVVPEPGWISLLGVTAAGVLVFLQRRRTNI